VIPRIEDTLIAELERRIVAAVPDTAPGDGESPETFVTTIESRTIAPNVQEGNDATVYCRVTADISVVFFGQKRRYDFSALLVDFAKRPFIELGDGFAAKVAIERSEAIEGPYLSNDAWLFRIEYPVFSIEPMHGWQQPQVNQPTVGSHDIYPRAEWDRTNEPDGGRRFERA
jgi:hypothetical protein